MGRYCTGWLLVALLGWSHGGSRFPRDVCPERCTGSRPPPGPMLTLAGSEKGIEIKKLLNRIMKEAPFQKSIKPGW